MVDRDVRFDPLRDLRKIARLIEIKGKPKRLLTALPAMGHPPSEDVIGIGVDMDVGFYDRYSCDIGFAQIRFDADLRRVAIKRCPAATYSPAKTKV